MFTRKGHPQNTRRAGHHLSDSSVLVCQRYPRTCVAPNNSSLGRHVRQWRCTYAETVPLSEFATTTVDSQAYDCIHCI